MKEQATVTARQTAWTVALTVLAAVYLPMTLVTGIFGMNITEVSSEKTAPNAWWAVGAWMVVVALTVTGMSLYMMFRKLRSRKKKSDLEANDSSGNGFKKAVRKAGEGLGGRAIRWVRQARQKLKAIWSRKRE
jgi:heme/copper-type cytochrome/quinol oxidase subunit 2